MDGIIPSAAQVRERIDRCGDDEYRACMRAITLMCARVSEVIGEVTPGDKKTTARGPMGSDAKAEWYEKDGQKYRALVFDVHTAKRKGLLRRPGVPADYDPWVIPTAQYFHDRVDQRVFPFTRRSLAEYIYSNGVFDGFFWPVNAYSKVIEGAVRDESTGEKLKKALWERVEDHPKAFTIHSLRDSRATQLMLEYGFEGPDLAIHGGWTIQAAAAGVSNVMARYLNIYQDWKRPFPKLLKKVY